MGCKGRQRADETCIADRRAVICVAGSGLAGGAGAGLAKDEVMAKRCKRLVVNVTLTAITIDCPLAGPALVQRAMWDVVRSRRRREHLLTLAAATLADRLRRDVWGPKEEGG